MGGSPELVRGVGLGGIFLVLGRLVGGGGGGGGGGSWGRPAWRERWWRGVVEAGGGHGGRGMVVSVVRVLPHELLVLLLAQVPETLSREIAERARQSRQEAAVDSVGILPG